MVALRFIIAIRRVFHNPATPKQQNRPRNVHSRRRPEVQNGRNQSVSASTGRMSVHASHARGFRCGTALGNTMGAEQPLFLPTHSRSSSRGSGHPSFPTDESRERNGRARPFPCREWAPLRESHAHEPVHVLPRPALDTSTASSLTLFKSSFPVPR